MKYFTTFSLLFIILFLFTPSLKSQIGFIQNWIPDNLGGQFDLVENHDFGFQLDGNGTIHRKVDYYKEFELKAEILSVLTESQCYSSSFNKILRSDFSRLEQREIINIDGYHVLVSRYNDPEDQIFYASQFAMIENGHLKFKLYNPWVDIWSGPEYRILNFYINSNEQSILNKLLIEMFNKFDKNADLSQSEDLILNPSIIMK